MTDEKPNANVAGRNAAEPHVLARVEAEFSRLLREAVAAGRFGQFGLIVSLQAGGIKTYQRHAIETLK